MAIVYENGTQNYASRFGQIQTKHNNNVYTISISGGSWTDANNMAVNITPRATTSQILVMAQVNGVCPNTSFYQVVRNGTAIAVGTSGTGNTTNVWAGSFYRNGDLNHGHTHSCIYLDSPSSTSQLTYKVQLRGDTNTTFYLNHNNNGANAPIAYHAFSSITVIELEAT